ncbi:MAG: HDOD domain-containing protein [Ignavibacteriaceae bacterium]|nr:HDOD domain-containing protein [Ignavibacteriaceae bacterium]
MTSDNHKREKTEALLAAINNLPSIPKVVFEVTRLLNDSKTATNRLSEVIGKDQGLTSKVLAIANSPLYGLKRSVSSIEFAILILGFQEIKNIVAALSFADSIEITPTVHFNPQEFWLHSILVGTAARGIAQNLGYEFGSEAFVAGLLHDLGILVIYKYFHSEFIQIIGKASSENIPIFEAETEILGLTHQEIGGFLADKWELPMILCDSINYHHVPYLANENKIFVSIIHLVDYMTQRLGIASFYWDKKIELDSRILGTLNFPSKESVDAFIADYDEMFTVTAESLKI